MQTKKQKRIMVQQRQQQLLHSHCNEATAPTLLSKEGTTPSPHEEEEKHQNKNIQKDANSPSKAEDKNVEEDKEEQMQGQETHTTDATTCGGDLNEDEDKDEDQHDNDDDVAEVRRLIAKGLKQLSHQERYQIEEEVHGIQSMGPSQGDEVTPHFKAFFLEKFKDHLEYTLILAKDEAKQTNAKANSEIELLSSSQSSNKSTTMSNTDGYELCLQKKYTYATDEMGSLRLMCLRAALWSPKDACTIFLNHLNALNKHFGDFGLKHPLTIDSLDYEQRGIYKRASLNKKASFESFPDMVELKSGIAQVLPSRDRCGRRVVFLQPTGLSIHSHRQAQHQHHSKVSQIFKIHCFNMNFILKRKYIKLTHTRFTY